MITEIYAPTEKAGMCLILRADGANPYASLQEGDHVCYPDWTTKNNHEFDPVARWGIVDRRELKILEPGEPVMVITVHSDPDREFQIETPEEYEIGPPREDLTPERITEQDFIDAFKEAENEAG